MDDACAFTGIEKGSVMSFTTFLHGLGLPFAGADPDLSQVQVAKPSRKSPPYCSRRRKLRLLCRHEATPGAAGWTRAGRKAARRMWQTARTRDEYEAGMALLAAIEHERATGVPRQEAGT